MLATHCPLMGNVATWQIQTGHVFNAVKTDDFHLLQLLFEQPHRRHAFGKQTGRTHIGRGIDHAYGSIQIGHTHQHHRAPTGCTQVQSHFRQHMVEQTHAHVPAFFR